MTGGWDDHGVLVVDDEPTVADMAAVQLRRDYEVSTAYGGAEALDRLDAGIDVVVLDRRMPEVPGDEVLSRIRAGDHDPRVVILSAVTPDYDLLELPFDDYLCKPVAGEPLTTAVGRQIETLGDETSREYITLEAKRDLLEAHKPMYELENNEAYQTLQNRLASLDGRLDDTADPQTRALVRTEVERT